MMKRISRFGSVFLAVLLMLQLFVFPAAAYSTVQKGSRGSDVKTLQTMLNDVDDAGLAVDGIFGNATLAAVKSFQQDNGLAVDGIAGPKTWGALEKQWNALKNGGASTLTIGSGRYNPGTLTVGRSYSINGKITSNYKITKVTVGVYTTGGAATAQVKTATPNAYEYNIKSLDNYIKFGSLSAGSYVLKITAADASGKVATKESAFNVEKVNTDLAWPLPNNTKISSYFGKRTAPGKGASSNHGGIDISAGYGVDILAAADGTVYVGCSSCTHNYKKSASCGCGGGYGNYVYIVHNNGLRTYYAHMGSVSVKNGTAVTQGAVLGTVGSTGMSTGAHLHFEIRTGSGSSTRVNPLDYVSH